jgi:hypothetical protein
VPMVPHQPGSVGAFLFFQNLVPTRNRSTTALRVPFHNSGFNSSLDQWSVESFVFRTKRRSEAAPRSRESVSYSDFEGEWGLVAFCLQARASFSSVRTAGS